MEVVIGGERLAGRARDAGRLADATGMDAGLVMAATGFAWASLLAGVGVGAATPLGFAALAAASSPGRLGQLLGVRTPAAAARTMSPT